MGAEDHGGARDAARKTEAAAREYFPEGREQPGVLQPAAGNCAEPPAEGERRQKEITLCCFFLYILEMARIEDFRSLSLRCNDWLYNPLEYILILVSTCNISLASAQISVELDLCLK